MLRLKQYILAIAAWFILVTIIICGWNHNAQSLTLRSPDRPSSSAAELQVLRYQLQQCLGTTNGRTAASPYSRETLLNSLCHDSTDLTEIKGFAYVFYATSDIYACSVLVNIYRLQHLFHTALSIHVLVSPEVSAVLLSALENTNSTVYTIEPPPLAEHSGPYYRDCLLKLLAFKMHILSPGLKRVLVLDSDQLVLKNLDHLFVQLPRIDLAAPRAYWLSKDVLSSTFMLITLSSRLWNQVQDALINVAYDKFDMDLVNDILGDTVMMLSGEYVTINSHWEDWNLPNWYHPEDETIVSESQQSCTFQADSVIDRMSLMPRFPRGHPLSIELHHLGKAASVIHFYALGKPWSVSAETVARRRPDSHPALAEQFHTWRITAAEVCPEAVQSMLDVE